MLKIKTSAIMTGMKLSKSIFNRNGQLLIENGSTLKESYIKKLVYYDIDNVYINWDSDVSPEVADAIVLDTKNEAMRVLRDSFKEIQVSKNVDIDRLNELVGSIIEELLEKKGTLINLTNIRSIDDYTFTHSINVCILSLVMGLALNYEKEQLEYLGIGSLLHDIGKVGIEPSILNKPGSLTIDEFDIVKNHAIIGYDMVKYIDGISEESVTIIRDHHERYDGKGYPNGKKGNEIHEFARIVAVCDVYDALTSNRVYRLGMPPHIGIEYLLSMANHQFDEGLVKLFTKYISIYPKGTVVELESGDRGIVVDQNECLPTRPVIEVIYDITGNKLGVPKIVDLAKNLNNGIISKLGII